MLNSLYSASGESWLIETLEVFRRLNSAADTSSFLRSNCFFGTATFSRRRIDRTRALLAMNNAAGEIEYEEFDRLYLRLLWSISRSAAGTPKPLAIVGIDYHGTRLAKGVAAAPTGAHLHFIFAFTDAQRDIAHELLTPFRVKYQHRRLMSHVDSLIIEPYDLSRSPAFEALTYSTKAFLKSQGGAQVSDPLHVYGNGGALLRYRTKRGIPKRRSYDERLAAEMMRELATRNEENEE